MLQLRNERLVTFDEAVEHVSNTVGREVSTRTVRRWAECGTAGVLLESIRLGGARLTSVEALERFLIRLNDRRQEPVSV